MVEKEVQQLSKYLFWGSIIILIILSFLIIRPFIISLISAFVLAYLSKPIFLLLEPKIGKRLSAIVCVILIIIIFILPLSTIAGGIINQATEALNADNLNYVLSRLSSFPIFEKFNIDLSDLNEKGLSFIISIARSSISYIPSFIITLLITLLGIYYILISWDNLSFRLEKYLPFKDKKRIRKEISKITNTIVYGTILIALIEFIISLNAFLILGVKSYLVLSALIFFLAFFPGLGPAIVWIPLAFYFLIVNNYFAAVGIIITGIILSIGIDAFLRAKILGDKIKINPLIMLIGILGGIYIFGIFGFIIGPLVLIYTIEILERILDKP